MAATVWKGYIAFGLISIPIRLFAAARDERISFNQIHKVCNSRIKQQLYCPTCERVVERSELAKGYPIGKDTYVLVEDEEIKKVAPTSSETMEIIQFVRLTEIDPLYFDASYFVVPEEAGKKPYTLLLQVMKNLNYVALAKVTMHQREFAVALRPYQHGLTLHTMYYAEEVRSVSEFEGLSESELKPQEVDMAEKLITALAKPFQPDLFHDEYQTRLMQMIEAKGEGKPVQGTGPKRLAPVIDLMKALENSLAEVQQPAGTTNAAAKKKAAGHATKGKTVAINHPKKSATG